MSRFLLCFVKAATRAVAVLAFLAAGREGKILQSKRVEVRLAALQNCSWKDGDPRKLPACWLACLSHPSHFSPHLQSCGLDYQKQDSAFPLGEDFAQSCGDSDLAVAGKEELSCELITCSGWSLHRGCRSSWILTFFQPSCPLGWPEPPLRFSAGSASRSGSALLTAASE